MIDWDELKGWLFVGGTFCGILLAILAPFITAIICVWLLCKTFGG